MHKTIKKVGEDIENLRFNTAISQMMMFVNEATMKDSISKSSFLAFLHLLSPFAPHICDELFEKLGEKGCLLNSQWPQFNEELLQENLVELGIQINGKKRGSIKVQTNTKEESIKELAINNEETKKFLVNKTIVKIIIVPNRIINIVVKDHE